MTVHNFKHKTKVKIDLVELRRVEEVLNNNFKAVNTRETKQGRSLFSAWNNINKFLGRIDQQGADSVILPITGAVSGRTLRVYNKPSITSMARAMRTSIVPTNPENTFMFFDIKAAEFILFCMLAGQEDAIEAYYKGEDVYMTFAHLFAPGTPRKLIKDSLIGNMYGLTAYRLAKDHGISETAAERILVNINDNLPAFKEYKNQILRYCKKHNGYYCHTKPLVVIPSDSTESDMRNLRKDNKWEIVKVSDIDPKKGFSEYSAYSTWIQSYLGALMQGYIKEVETWFPGNTLLTVFDSMLIEIPRDKEKETREKITIMLHPFLTSDIVVADDFFTAQELAD